MWSCFFGAATTVRGLKPIGGGMKRRRRLPLRTQLVIQEHEVDDNAGGSTMGGKKKGGPSFLLWHRHQTDRPASLRAKPERPSSWCSNISGTILLVLGREKDHPSGVWTPTGRSFFVRPPEGPSTWCSSTCRTTLLLVSINIGPVLLQPSEHLKDHPFGVRTPTGQ